MWTISESLYYTHAIFIHLISQIICHYGVEHFLQSFIAKRTKKSFSFSFLLVHSFARFIILKCCIGALRSDIRRLNKQNPKMTEPNDETKWKLFFTGKSIEFARVRNVMSSMKMYEKKKKQKKWKIVCKTQSNHNRQLVVSTGYFIHKKKKMRPERKEWKWKAKWEKYV